MLNDLTGNPALAQRNEQTTAAFAVDTATEITNMVSSWIYRASGYRTDNNDVMIATYAEIKAEVIRQLTAQSPLTIETKR